MIIFWVTLLTAYLMECHGACNENVESEKQSVLRDYDYRRYWETIEIIKTINVTCENITFPMDYKLEHTCIDCPITLNIINIDTNVMPSNAFVHVSSDFNILVLKNENIINILPAAFGRLNLKQIDLSSNQITDISLGVLNSLVDLEILDLSKNNLTNLPHHFLSGITKLKQLNISYNYLSEFNFDVVDFNVENMSYIDFSYNNLTNFFANKEIVINDLFLNNNQLTEIDICPLKVGSVYLQHNLFETLPSTTCFSEILNLDLSFNQISDTDKYYFENISTLEYLYLNNNNISIISTSFFFNLNNLKLLNLSANQLTEFQHGTFDNLNQLETLDLSYNSIKSLDRSLHALINLKELYLQYNKLNSINGMRLIRDSPNLQQISFDGNQISCEELITIIYDIKGINKNISITYGDIKNRSNIHGIACNEETDWLPNNDKKNLENAIKNIFSSVLKEVTNKSVTHNDAVQDYFNNEFKNSNFYKFLTNFQSNSTLKLSDTQLFKYFNEDFENSKFYKYLESLKDKGNETNFKKNVYDYFNSDFKQSAFVKYLENIKNYKISTNDNFVNSSMYNYFNKDFENSKFYKYLENLKNIPIQNQDSPAYEKLFIDLDKTSYEGIKGILIVNMIFLIFVFLLLTALVYKIVLRKHKEVNEQVELLEKQAI